MGIIEVVKAVKKYEKFLITSHIHPEGDAIGSGLALGSLLKQLGKRVYVVNEHKIPLRYRFLPFSDQAMSMNDVSKRTDFEVAIILDCPDMTRVGKVKKLIPSSVGKKKNGKEKIVINIDHHISNKRFGSINWVDSKASSAGEMVYRLSEKLGCRIKKQEALNLYVAILTDTGSFKFNNTRPLTHKIIAQLLEYKLNPNDVYDRIYEADSSSELKLLGLVLSGISISGDRQIAWLKITRDMFAKVGEGPEAADGFVEFARAIRGVKVGILFSERKEGVKVSMRSKQGIDVNKVAQSFGGGGHQAASGCMVRGSLKEVEKKVLQKVRKAL